MKSLGSYFLIFAVLLGGSKAYADLKDLLRACIQNTSGDDDDDDKTPSLSKVHVNGTSDTIVMMSCFGPPAEALYEGLKYYSQEGGPTVATSDNSRVMRRYFGNLRVPSQCARTIEDAYGRGENEYSCSIAVDLNSSVVKAM